MKRINFTLLLAVLMSIASKSAFAYDVAVKNSDSIVVYYNFINDKSELEVTYESCFSFPNEPMRDSYTTGYRTVTTLNIPEQVSLNGKTYKVTSIGEEAFMGNVVELKTVNIPNSVTKIGRRAFTSSTITSVSFGNSLKTIGAWAFAYSDVTSIAIPNSVTSIGEKAFYGCFKLKSIIIGDGVKSISLGWCGALQSIEVGHSVTYLSCPDSSPVRVIWQPEAPPETTFYKRPTINYVPNQNYPTNKFPNQTIYTQLSSIFDVDGIIYVPVSISDRTCDAIGCMYDSSAEKINIGKTVSYKNILMKVNYISPKLCYNNNNVKEIQFNYDGNIPDSIFWGCTNLEKVLLNNTGNIGQGAFSRTAIKELIVGNNINNIGTDAFSNCELLSTVKLFNTGDIEENAFVNSSINGSLIVMGGIIKKSSFSNIQGNFTASLNPQDGNIGDSAFEQSIGLTSVTIPNSVTCIGINAFSGCSSLISVAIPNSVTSIGEKAFSGCSSLEKVVIGSSVKEIRDQTFLNCTKLQSITIPKTVMSIKYKAFSGSSLKNVVIAKRTDLLSIESQIFYGCPLDYVYIGGNISFGTSRVDSSPFYGKKTLRTIVLNDNVTSILPNEFYGCSSLENVTVGEGITGIGDKAFYGCSNLQKFTFSSQLQTIGKGAFGSCTAMVQLYSKAVVPPICEEQALDDINKWECKLFVPKGSKQKYMDSLQWKDFFFVEEGIPTGIAPVKQEKIAEEECRYDLNGNRVKGLRRGVNIVKTSDGKTRKVVVK